MSVKSLVWVLQHFVFSLTEKVVFNAKVAETVYLRLLKPDFHIAVRCRKVAAAIVGTIAAGMPQLFQLKWKPLLSVPPAAATIVVAVP